MAMTLITTNTESNAASSSFTSGIDSTYKLYIFKFIDIHPVTDDTQLNFYGSTDGGSSYGVTKTTTFFRTYHTEDDATALLGYIASGDQAQSTNPQGVIYAIGNDNDRCGVGTLHLFNPSSTTYVKHFYDIGQSAANAYTYQIFPAGYFNTTSAINAVKFQLDSGNFDGTIKMYGVG